MKVPSLFLRNLEKSRYAAMQHFIRRRGSVAIFAAVIILVLFFFAGLSIDFGLALLTMRRLQAATDAAALAASQNPSNSQTAVSDLLAANGFASAQVLSLTTGSYVADQRVPPSQRYTPNNQPINAVALSTDMLVPMRFISALVPHAQIKVPATAGAVQVTEAGLTAGSGLSSLSGGLPNAILGGLLGSQVNVDDVSYNGLANASVNALQFLNALAAQTQVTTGTYGQLLTGSATVSQVLNAEIAALNSPGAIGGAQAASALQTIAAQVNGSEMVALGTLFNAGLWSPAQVGSMDAASALDAQLNAYQLLTFTAQIANGGHFVQAPAAITIPGVASIDVATTVIEPPQGSYFAVGPTGTTVHTAQVRVQLTANLLSLVAVMGSPTPVSLPIYEEVASGTATIQKISCGALPATDAQVSVSAISGVSTAYVGQVPQNVMSNVNSPVSVSPATLINTPLMTVTGQAEVTVQGDTQSLVFNQQQIGSLTPQTISSTNMTSNFLQTLQSTLLLQSHPLSVPNLPALLSPILAPVFANLDSLTDQLLRTLGIRVGYLDVTVTGVRCGVPALFE